MNKGTNVLWRFAVDEHYVWTVTDILPSGQIKLNNRFTVNDYEIIRIEDDKGFQLTKGGNND